MSLILEALRKSEAERRRGQAPDVALELPPVAARTPPAHHRWWLPALLLVLCGVLALGWLRKPAAETTAMPAPAPITPPVSPPAPAAVMPEAPRIVARQPTPTPPVVKPQLASANSAAPTSTTAPATPKPAASAAPPPAIAVENLPPIKLSMHLWNPVPAKRFVIINGQRMGEGEHFDGLAVLEIDRNGVTIERNGQRTHIPLP